MMVVVVVGKANLWVFVGTVIVLEEVEEEKVMK